MVSRVALMVCCAVLSASPAFSQAPPLTFPEPSPEATVTQRIGLTDLTVVYHRPSVRQREIWGSLVPYDQVWRAGANENTVLTLTSPAKVGGQLVPTGSYGLHMIPARGEWTIILSRESTAWGSFFYDPKDDAARFTVTPRAADHQEHLLYVLDEPSDAGVTLLLRWEKLAVPMRIDIDTPAVVTENLRRELRGLPGFFWQSYAQAARWAARSGVNLEEAGAWADRAIAMNRNFTTLRTKALVLEKRGDAAGGSALREQALALATEADMNVYGYELLQAGNVQQAIDVFRSNVKKYPESWNVYDSLGEALAAGGDKAGAKAQYEKALSMAPDDVNRTRIRAILAGLEAPPR